MSVIDVTTPITASKVIYAPQGANVGVDFYQHGEIYTPVPDEIEVQTLHAVAFKAAPNTMFWVPRHKLVRLNWGPGLTMLGCALSHALKLVCIHQTSPKKADDEMVVIIKAEASGKTQMAVRLRVEAGSNSTGTAEEIWFPAYLATHLAEGFWAIKAQIALEKGIQAHVG